MFLVPAIDLLDGKVVRVEQGDPERAKVYSGDPLQTCETFIKNGAKVIHVIDLDAAVRNDPAKTTHIIDGLLRNFGKSTTFEIGGGIRNSSRAASLSEKGARRIILSSLVYSDLDQALKIKDQVRATVILALDYDAEGMVRTSGWKRQEKESVDAAVERFLKLSFSSFLLTAIERDGMLNGPDSQKLAEIKRSHNGARITASGGVSSMADILALQKAGVDEVIVGKALYESKIPLSELSKTNWN